MKQRAVFYHAGCPICTAAEEAVSAAIDPARYELETAHLGRDRSRLAAAEAAGVTSVPALVLGGRAYHLHRGSEFSELKQLFPETDGSA